MQPRSTGMFCGLLLATALVAPPAVAVETPITVSPLAVDFGEVSVGGTTQVPVQVTNTSPSSTFGPINIFGGAPPTAEFGASQSCQGVTLAAGASCQVTYSFSPTGVGSFQDTSSFTISQTPSQADGEDFSVALSGRAGPDLTVSPLALDFDRVAVGDTEQRSVQVTNDASSPFGPVHVFGGEPSTAAFTVSDDCEGATLAPGAACRITYAFSPVEGARVLGSSGFTVSETASAADGAAFSVALAGLGFSRHDRTVTLELRGDLVAVGRVSATPDLRACESRATVTIQRRDGARWRAVGTSTTDRRGRFRELLADRPGTYRAKVAREGALGGTVECLGDVSPIRR